MAHLTEESDVEAPHLMAQRLIQEGIRAGRGRPVALRFSYEGHDQALYRTVPGMDPWGRDPRSVATHYLGLPFERVRDQVDPITIVHEGDTK